MNEVEKEFVSKGRQIGNVFLLQAVNAIEFIDKCKNLNINIAGIEGFKLFNEIQIQPFQEHSVDYESDKNTHERAKDFLKKRIDLNLWFEVVIDYTNANQ